MRREQLPALIFNATLGSDEYQAFWRSTPAPGQYPRVSRATASATLSGINEDARRWLGGDYRAQNRALELLLSEVAGGDGGALLAALARQHDWVDRANRMLALPAARVTQCFQQPRDGASALTAALVAQYNSSALPARAAALARRYHQLLPHIAALEAQLTNTLPPRYRHWMDARNQHLAQFTAAPRQHLEQLQRLPHTCAAR